QRASRWLIVNLGSVHTNATRIAVALSGRRRFSPAECKIMGVILHSRAVVPGVYVIRSATSPLASLYGRTLGLMFIHNHSSEYLRRTLFWKGLPEFTTTLFTPPARHP